MDTNTYPFFLREDFKMADDFTSTFPATYTPEQLAQLQQQANIQATQDVRNQPLSSKQLTNTINAAPSQNPTVSDEVSETAAHDAQILADRQAEADRLGIAKKLRDSFYTPDFLTLGERKQRKLNQVKAEKEAIKTGKPVKPELTPLQQYEETGKLLQQEVTATDQNQFARQFAIAQTKAKATFDADTVSGYIGNTARRIAKSFTDIANEDIISSDSIDNSLQMDEQDTRNVENAAHYVTENLNSALADFEEGNVLDGATKAVSAIFDMGQSFGNSIWEHPSQIIDGLADSAAWFVGGGELKSVKGVFGASRDISYALRAGQAGIQNFKETYGREPTEHEVARIMVTAGLSGALSHMSSGVLRGEASLFLRKPVNVVTQQSARLAQATAQKVAKSVIGRQALKAAGGVTKVGVTLGKGAIQEGLEESAQEYLEGAGQSGSFIPTAEEIEQIAESGFMGATIGATTDVKHSASELVNVAKRVPITNAIDIQDAQVRKLMKQATKATTPEQRQELYSKAAKAKAKADKEKETLENRKQILVKQRKVIAAEHKQLGAAPTEGAVPPTKEQKAQYETLTNQINTIQTAINTAKENNEDTVSIGAEALSVAEAQTQLGSLNEQRNQLPSPDAPKQPITAKQRRNALRDLDSAINTIDNKLAMYNRTSKAVDAYSKRFGLSEEQLNEADTAAKADLTKQAKKSVTERATEAVAGQATARPVTAQTFEPAKSPAYASITQTVNDQDTSGKYSTDSKAENYSPEQRFVQAVNQYNAANGDKKKQVEALKDILDFADVNANEEGYDTAYRALINRHQSADAVNSKLDFMHQTAVDMYAHLQGAKDLNHINLNQLAKGLGEDTALDEQTRKQLNGKVLQSLVTRATEYSKSENTTDPLTNFIGTASSESVADFIENTDLDNADKGMIKSLFSLMADTLKAQNDGRKSSSEVNNEITELGNTDNDLPSIAQHVAAVTKAVLDGDKSAALAAFAAFDKFAHYYADTRAPILRAIEQLGLTTQAAQEGERTPEIEKKLKGNGKLKKAVNPSPELYAYITEESQAFFTQLEALSNQLEEKFGTDINHWWENKFISSNAVDPNYIAAANDVNANQDYQFGNITKPNEEGKALRDNPDSVSGVIKARLRRYGNLLSTFGRMVRENTPFHKQGANNLIARLQSGKLQFKDITQNGESLSAEQTSSWNVFSEFHNKFVASWKAAVKPDYHNGRNNDADPLSSFMGDNEVDPNLVSMAALHAHDWLTNHFNDLLTTDEDRMRRMFGLGESEGKPTDIYKLLQAVSGKGLPQSLIQRDLGLAIMRYTGIDLDSTGENRAHCNDYMASAIGGAVIETLIKQKVLAKHYITVADYPSLGLTGGKSGKITLLGINHGLEGGRVVPIDTSLTELVDKNRGKGNLLKVFNGETSQPTLHRTKEDLPTHTHTTRSNVLLTPERQADVKAVNETPRTLKIHWKGYMKNLNADFWKTLQGFNEQVGNLNIRERDSVLAKNQQVQNNIDNAYDLLNQAGDSTFYINHEITSNNRFNVRDLADYQTNKIIRMMIHTKPSTIHMSNKAEANAFISAATIYMNGSDAMRTDSNGLTHRTMQTAPIELRYALVDSAVTYLTDNGTFDLMAKAQNEQLTDAEIMQLQNLLLDFESAYDVEEGAELVEQVHGLMEYANRKDGVFTSTLHTESDGTSNGVFLSMVMMGQYATVQDAIDDLAKYGINSKGQWATTGKPATVEDIYESIGRVRQDSRTQILENITDATRQNAVRDAMEVMDTLIGNAADRNANKPHTMTTAYAMAIKGQYAEMFNLLDSKITSALSAAVPQDFAGRKAAINQLTGQINTLLRAVAPNIEEYKPLAPHEILSGLSENSTWDRATIQNITLNASTATKLENYITTIEGVALKEALDANFSGFNTGLSVINETAGAIYDIAQQARNILMGKYLQQALTNDDITQSEFDAKKLPKKYADMLEEEYINSMLSPRAKTASSDAANPNTYFTLGTNDLKVSYAKTVQRTDGQGTKSNSYGTITRIEAAPGVRVPAVFTHTADGYCITPAMVSGLLGVHDAIVGSPLEVNKAAVTYNQDVYNVLNDYSHLGAVVEAFQNQLEGLVNLSTQLSGELEAPQQDQLLPIYKTALKRFNKSKSDLAEIDKMSYAQALVAINNEKARLAAIKQRRDALVKDMLAVTDGVNQMSTGNITTWNRKATPISKVNMGEREPSVALNANIHEDFLTILPLVVQNYMDSVSKWLSDNSPKTTSDKQLDVDTSVIVKTNERAWLKGLLDSLNALTNEKAIKQAVAIDSDYSVAAALESVISRYESRHSVLISDERRKQILNALRRKANTSEETAAAQVSEQLGESIKADLRAVQNRFVYARDEARAIEASKGNFNVPVAKQTKSALGEIAANLGERPNGKTIAELFNTSEIKGFASKYLRNTKKRRITRNSKYTTRNYLSKGVQAALAILQDTDDIRVGVIGKKSSVVPENARDDNHLVDADLAHVPFKFLDSGAVILAPAEFAHSVFNNPANLCKLATAIRMAKTDNIQPTYSNQDEVRWARIYHELSKLNTSLLPETPPQDSVSLRSLLNSIVQQYVANPVYAEALKGVKRDLNDLVTSLTKRNFNLQRQGAKDAATEEIFEEESDIVEESLEETPKTESQQEPESEDPTVRNSLYNLAAEFDAASDIKRKQIDGADVVETLVNLGSTYGREPVEHEDHLKSLLTSFKPVLGKLSLAIQMVKGGNNQGYQRGAEVGLRIAENGGVIPSSMLIAQGQVQGIQEVFAHEVVHAATYTTLEADAGMYNEAVALLEEARTAKNPDGKTPLITFETFLAKDIDPNATNHTLDEREQIQRAKHMYDYIFNPIADSESGKSNYISEFIAYANTNRRFRKALQQINAKPNPVGTNWLGKAKNFVSKVANFLTKASDTTDPNLLVRVDNLTRRLAQIDEAGKSGLMSAADNAAIIGGKALAGVTLGVSQSLALIGKAAQTTPFQVTKNLGQTAIDMAGGQVTGILEAMDMSFDTLAKDRVNALTSLWSEIVGKRKYEKNLRSQIRLIAGVDQQAQQIKDAVSTTLDKAFSRKLTESEQKDITDIFLRTDLASISHSDTRTGGASFDSIIKLLTQPNEIDNEIARYTADLPEGKVKNFYIRNARALGAYLATGKVVDNLLLNNATQIALEHGTPNSIAGTESNIRLNRKTIATIDKLSSMYALKFSDREQRSRAASLMANEATGIAMVLSSYDSYKKASLRTVFKDSPSTMVKGYLPDQNSPYVELKLASKDAAANLAVQGWTISEELVKDKNDIVNKDMVYYVRSTSAASRYVRGGFDLGDISARGLMGTKIRTGQGESYKAFEAKNKVMTKALASKATAMYAPLTHPYTLTDEQITARDIPNRMAPVIDRSGAITEYRYLLPNSIKDNVLQRKHSPTGLLAKAYGQLQTKSDMANASMPLVSELKSIYDELPASKKDTLVEISATAANPRAREAYDLLPKYIKEEVRNVWKADKMLVPAGLMDVVFGNRSLSIESWLREPRIAQEFSKLAHTALKGIFGNNVAFYAGSAQNLLTSGIAQAKKAIITKSADVLKMNNLSNIAILSMQGMKPSDITRYYREAIPMTLQYQRETEELFTIDLKLGAISTAESEDNRKAAAELVRRKNQIVDSLQRNPMRSLMDAGAYTNIASQLGLTGDDMHFQTYWGDKLTKLKEKFVNDKVAAVIDEVALTDNSRLAGYAALGTELTDFVARYALVKHLTDRRRANPLKEAEAIDKAMDVFIDFSAPTSAEMQLANDLGLFMFTKYRLRAAKSLMVAAELNPNMTVGGLVLDKALQVSNLGGVTPISGSYGLTGVIDSLGTPWGTLMHISDNTLLDYIGIL